MGNKKKPEHVLTPPEIEKKEVVQQPAQDTEKGPDGTEKEAHSAKTIEVEEEVTKLQQEMNYLFIRGKYPLQVVGAALLESLGVAVVQAADDMNNEEKTQMKVNLETYFHSLYERCGMRFLG
jgi:hypothetical protein